MNRVDDPLMLHYYAHKSIRCIIIQVTKEETLP